MAKVVSNLLTDISKARDLIARGDVREIYNKRVIFERISRGVKTQLKFYVKSPAHELDFNHEDLKELSTEVFEYIKNFQQKFLYSKMYKDITAVTPITKEIFQKFSTRIGYEFKVHAELTAFYKEMAYLGLTIFLWSQTDDKKPFDEQLTDFNYGIICNHKLNNGQITGFEGQATTETECYANLINAVWDVLTEEEKSTITNILKDE